MNLAEWIFSRIFINVTFPLSDTYEISKVRLFLTLCHIIIVVLLEVYLLIFSVGLYSDELLGYFGDITSVIYVSENFTFLFWLIYKKVSLKEIWSELKVVSETEGVVSLSPFEREYAAFVVIMAVDIGSDLLQKRHPCQVLVHFSCLTFASSLLGQMMRCLGPVCVHVGPSQGKGLTTLVRRLASLVSLANRLVAVYGPLILLVLLRVYVVLVSLLYGSFADALGASFLDWIASSCSTIIVIILVCNKVKSMERRFNEELYMKMVRNNSTDDLITDEVLNFHFLGRTEIEFTACGFFTLNNGLLCSLIVTATTYVVICLQYRFSAASYRTSIKQQEKGNEAFNVSGFL